MPMPKGKVEKLIKKIPYSFENSTIKGRGVYKTLTGEIFDGTWNNNLPNGQGSYYFKGKHDGVLYSGNFKN